MRIQHIFITAAIITAGFSSCKKSFFDINHDPNNATNTTPELVLPNALASAASMQVIGDFNGGFGTSYIFWQGWMDYWAPSGSYAINSSDVASYKLTSSFGDFGIWQASYDNLQDLHYIENAAAAQNKPFYEGVAKVMKAFIFQQLVDVYDDVPYSDAFHGTDIIAPRYDKGSDIYDSIVKEINEGVTLLQGNNVFADDNTDIVFDGDAAKWVQFANTLKLRILVRLSQVSSRASFIQSEIGKITANGGGFLDEDAGANPGYANNAGQQNPVYGFFVTLTGLPTSGGSADYWRGAQYSINFLQTNNDPRLSRIYSPGAGGVFQGDALGSSSNFAGDASSGIGPGILKSVDQPALLISAAESHFLQAEAALRGWLGNAATVTTEYNAGVQANFDYLGAGDATEYYSQENNKNTNITAAASFNEKLAVIIRQKWVAMNGITPLEAWDDYRRLHLPADLALSVSPYTQGHIPTRLQYPNSEYQTNATNVAAEGTIDSQTSKVFWMP